MYEAQLVALRVAAVGTVEVRRVPLPQPRRTFVCTAVGKCGPPCSIDGFTGRRGEADLDAVAPGRRQAVEGLRASHNCGTKCHVPALEEGVETAETPGDGFRAGWLVAA